ncbi:hypothetical protein L21SP3_02262 [Sedimentisphaera cyanobacteriorum]|uniref:Uncharacterized protein n=1 Tax=Sedimentisphaera cyanobacteriorum TaxID=1940790 RepID=A0A1Q2HST2_9BACT|nr:hypothetical protein [Sedimentisphaera cyanobacteriorum]AQQ10430.1 hypothetical protein L21SP3_02262 [Sedimentisphaera cyanobacteriorum]
MIIAVIILLITWQDALGTFQSPIYYVDVECRLTIDESHGGGQYNYPKKAALYNQYGYPIDANNYLEDWSFDWDHGDLTYTNFWYGQKIEAFIFW